MEEQPEEEGKGKKKDKRENNKKTILKPEEIEKRREGIREGGGFRRDRVKIIGRRKEAIDGGVYGG